jgi:flavin-dependent dehydrogenase
MPQFDDHLCADQLLAERARFLGSTEGIRTRATALRRHDGSNVVGVQQQSMVTETLCAEGRHLFPR